MAYLLSYYPLLVGKHVRLGDKKSVSALTSVAMIVTTSWLRRGGKRVNMDLLDLA
jgi:hypothetical protein